VAKKTTKKVRPFYQYEYDRTMALFREKRKLMRRLLDIMDQDESGHDWPGLWWTETINDLQFLALQLGMMRQAAKDRDEPIEPVVRG
jgi:hypothetical protein